MFLSQNKKLHTYAVVVIKELIWVALMVSVMWATLMVNVFLWSFCTRMELENPVLPTHTHTLTHTLTYERHRAAI